MMNRIAWIFVLGTALTTVNAKGLFPTDEPSTPSRRPATPAQDEPGPVVDPAAPLPVPTEAELAQAERTLKKTLRREYAMRLLEHRKILLGELLKQAAKAGDDAATRYVALREARDVAVGMGDCAKAMDASKHLVNSFELDGPKVTLELLLKLKPASAEDSELVARTGSEILERALEEDRYDLVAALRPVLESVLGQVKDTSWAAEVQARLKAAAAMQKKYEVIQSAEAVLRARPNDPKANLTLGKFYCFTKGDWEKGLRPLSLGSDTELQAAAKEDLTNPSEAKMQAAVANRWWQVAESRRGTVREQCRARAAYWYKLALPKLTGLTSAIAQRRVDEATGEKAAGN